MEKQFKYSFVEREGRVGDEWMKDQWINGSMGLYNNKVAPASSGHGDKRIFYLYLSLCLTLYVTNISFILPPRGLNPKIRQLP